MSAASADADYDDNVVVRGFFLMGAGSARSFVSQSDLILTISGENHDERTAIGRTSLLCSALLSVTRGRSANTRVVSMGLPSGHPVHSTAVSMKHPLAIPVTFPSVLHQCRATPLSAFFI
jgi:hypothetical protein